MYRLPVHRNWEPITARFTQSSRCPLPRKLIVTATYPQYASTYTPAGRSLTFEIKIEDSDNFGGDPRQVHATEDLPNLDWKPALPPIASHPISSNFPRQITLFYTSTSQGPTLKICPTPSVSGFRIMMLGSLRGKGSQSGKMPSFIC